VSNCCECSLSSNYACSVISQSTERNQNSILPNVYFDEYSNCAFHRQNKQNSSPHSSGFKDLQTSSVWFCVHWTRLLRFWTRLSTLYRQINGPFFVPPEVSNFFSAAQMQSATSWRRLPTYFGSNPNCRRVAPAFPKCWAKYNPLKPVYRWSCSVIKINRIIILKTEF
jgi:hypothetical protein